MSFRGYSLCFWSLLVIGFLLLASSGLIAAFGSPRFSDTKRVLAGLALVLVAGAFVVNAAAGYSHGRLWARGGVITREQQGIGWFRYMLVMNALVAAIAIAASYRIWIGTVPVFP